MQDNKETENLDNDLNNDNKQQDMIPKEEFDKLKDDFDNLKELKKRLFDELHDLKAEAKNREEQENSRKQERMKKDGRFEDLYQDAMEKLKAEKEARENDRKSAENEKLDRLAQQLAIDAGAVGTDVKYVARDIRDRLTMNEGQVGVLDQNGKLTISAPKDLVSEIQSNEQYAKYIVDRQASGGGAIGNTSSGAQNKKFGDLNESERVQLYRESPAKYNQAKMAYIEQD